MTVLVLGILNFVTAAAAAAWPAAAAAAAALHPLNDTGLLLVELHFITLHKSNVV